MASPTIQRAGFQEGPPASFPPSRDPWLCPFQKGLDLTSSQAGMGSLRQAPLCHSISALGLRVVAITYICYSFILYISL